MRLDDHVMLMSIYIGQFLQTGQGQWHCIRKRGGEGRKRQRGREI